LQGRRCRGRRCRGRRGSVVWQGAVAVGEPSGRRPVVAGGPPSEGRRRGGVLVEGRRPRICKREVAWRQRRRCRGHRRSVLTGPSLQRGGGRRGRGTAVGKGPSSDGSSQASSEGVVGRALLHTHHAFASAGGFGGGVAVRWCVARPVVTSTQPIRGARRHARDVGGRRC
jgi:hypothetical protein